MVADKVLLSKNISIAYRWINKKADGPIILFLHEGLGSIEQWKKFPEELCRATGLRGLVYDRQGYGASTALTEKRDETYLENYAIIELPELLSSLKISEKLILFGHSDGGSIALIYGSHFPNNVIGIITEAAHVFVEDITLDGITPVVNAFEHHGLYDKLKRYHGEKTKDTFYAWSDTWHTKQFKSWDITARLPNINCPVLAIQGRDDEYGTEAQLDKIITGVGLKSKKVIIDHCGHAPHKSHTNEVISLTQKFITHVFN